MIKAALLSPSVIIFIILAVLNKDPWCGGSNSKIILNFYQPEIYMKLQIFEYFGLAYITML